MMIYIYNYNGMSWYVQIYFSYDRYTMIHMCVCLSGEMEECHSHDGIPSNVASEYHTVYPSAQGSYFDYNSVVSLCLFAILLKETQNDLLSNVSFSDSQVLARQLVRDALGQRHIASELQRGFAEDGNTKKTKLSREMYR